MSDERIRKLKRSWQQYALEEDGWGLIFERLRNENLLLKVLKHLVRLETVLRAGVTAAEGIQRLQGSAEISAKEVLAWLDQEVAYANLAVSPHGPQPAPVRLIPENRGYSSDWLNAPCGACTHYRGHHQRPPEDRGRCMIPDCGCKDFNSPL